MSPDRSPPKLSIDATPGSESESFGIWGRAFRPFFLGLAIYGTLAVPWWILVWLGALPAAGWLIPAWWHGHEMMFGLVAVAIAGFLLTASPVWTMSASRFPGTGVIWYPK